MWSDLFLEHPHAVGETYFQHQRRALRFAAELVVAGFACAVHAVAPRLFATTASAAVRRLHQDMAARTVALSVNHAAIGAGPAEQARAEPASA